MCQNDQTIQEDEAGNQYRLPRKRCRPLVSYDFLFLRLHFLSRFSQAKFRDRYNRNCFAPHIYLNSQIGTKRISIKIKRRSYRTHHIYRTKSFFIEVLCPFFYNIQSNSHLLKSPTYVALMPVRKGKATIVFNGCSMPVYKHELWIICEVVLGRNWWRSMTEQVTCW